MKVSPQEISDKVFTKKMRGFDPMEVTLFLKKVAAEYEGIYSEFHDLKKAFKESEVKLQEYSEREDLFKKTLHNATKMSDRIKNDSDREARLIVNDAQHKAEIIIRDARDSLRRIYADISDLKRIRLQFENNLRALLSSHVTMLEQGKRTLQDPLIPEEKIKENLREVHAEVTEPETLPEPNVKAPELML